MSGKFYARLVKKILPKGGIKNFNPSVPLIYASDHAKKGHSIPDLVVQYGTDVKRYSFKSTVQKYHALFAARKSYTDARMNPKVPKTEAEPAFFEEFAAYAKSLGILDLGYVKIDPDDLFQNSAVLYGQAFIITLEMDQEAVNKAPSKETGYEVYRTYNQTGILVNKLAFYLRQKGYGAQAGPAYGGDANYITLAKKAGLGEIGIHGLLISPKAGPRQRIGLIYTSIENLPYQTADDHGWIKDFCAKCKMCVRKCPSNAIFEEPQKDYNDTYKHIDYEKCAVLYANDYGCTLCIKECPFNKTDYDKIKKAFMAKNNKPAR